MPKEAVPSSVSTLDYVRKINTQESYKNDYKSDYKVNDGYKTNDNNYNNYTKNPLQDDNVSIGGDKKNIGEQRKSRTVSSSSSKTSNANKVSLF